MTNNDEANANDGMREEQPQPRPSISYHELEEINMTEEQLEREVKKYKLQTEVDMIMNDPDGAPFDLETELTKVNGGISPPLPMGSIEASTEEKVHEIETAMYEAAEAGDYNLAQAKKKELNQMHIDDVGSVLQVNSAFYKAFSNKDYDSMEEIWLHDASALCIHPSNKPIIGAKNVLASWKQMFTGGIEAFQKNRMEPTNIRLSVKGTTAILTCDEDVYTKRFVRGKKRVGDKFSKNGMELVNKLISTNIFRKVGGRWYMIHHHATWHSESDAGKKALSAQAGASGTKAKLLNSSKNKEGGDMTVEGMLGIPGHEGLGGEKKKQKDDPEEQPGGPTRRIFRGSLSDLLGGGLGDLFGGDDDDEDNAGGGMIGGIEGIIVRDGDLDDDDDDEDDDDDGGVINAKKSKVITVDPEPEKKGQAKDLIRQNCIKALRKLANAGSISPKQKRMLLTDIIVKSSTGDYSMAEVAYDLLCSEGDDQDAGEEDFAEQCKVFAATLPEVPIQIQQ